MSICSILARWLKRSKEFNILCFRDFFNMEYPVCPLFTLTVHACYLCSSCVHVYTAIIGSYLHSTLGSLSVSDLDTVMEKISAVCGKWEGIGRGLGMEEEYLTEIHTSYSTSHDRMREMLNRWLNREAGPGTMFVDLATWSRIIVAVSKVNEPQLADSLKAKYIPGELITTSSSQYSLESQHGENEMM